MINIVEILVNYFHCIDGKKLYSSCVTQLVNRQFMQARDRRRDE